MQPNRFIGNNTSEALSLVKAKLGEDAPYTVVDHGQDNLIILTGNDVYRFPRTEAVWERAELEHFVLTTSGQSARLPMPLLKTVSQAPAYIVTSELPGNPIEKESIRPLPTEIQRQIGKQIGNFAAVFHTTFNPSVIRPFLAEPAPQAWYERYLHLTLGNVRGTVYDELAQWVLSDWPKHDHSENTVIHDDFHTHNMLFDDAYTLRGVLDFGDVNLGNPEQDLRYTYWISDEVMSAAVQSYTDVSGQGLDEELIKLCAVSQELSGLFDPARSYMHERARHNLSYRFPELETT